MQTVAGWLFGLNSAPGANFSCSNLTIREMTAEEKNQVLRSAQDFFAKDQRIWINCIKKFPLMFERQIRDELSFRGTDIVAVLLSLLSPGEIRTPFLWLVRKAGGGATASNSQVIEVFYRLINGKFHTVDFHAIKASAEVMFKRLEGMLSSDRSEHIDLVLEERLFEAKRHMLTTNAISEEIVARAADTCIALESLYNEGSSSEIQFRLAISIACLLERDPFNREGAMKAIIDTYGLRSKVVHGSKPAKDTQKKIESVVYTDRFLRRSILTRLLNRLDEKSWIATFQKARLGIPYEGDTAEWVNN